MGMGVVGLGVLGLGGLFLIYNNMFDNINTVINVITGFHLEPLQLLYLRVLVVVSILKLPM